MECDAVGSGPVVGWAEAYRLLVLDGASGFVVSSVVGLSWGSDLVLPQADHAAYFGDTAHPFVALFRLLVIFVPLQFTALSTAMLCCIGVPARTLRLIVLPMQSGILAGGMPRAGLAVVRWASVITSPWIMSLAM